MEKIIPVQLQKGDKVMIVAPSRGLRLIGADCRQIAEKRFADMGLELVFAPNTNDENFDRACSWNAKARAEDLMTAFADKSVKAIFTVLGGFNSNQILPLLDFETIRKNPKIFCGFSDITALHAAINAKTGLQTYYGPHYSSIGMKKGCEYTLEYLQKMLFSNEPVEVKPATQWSDDAWFLDQENRKFIKNDGFWQIHEGKAEGTIVGGNLCTFNLLLGTDMRPAFEKDTVLMIEDDAGSSPAVFDRNLQALCYQPDFGNVKGIVIGRFQKGSEMSREMLEFIINSKPELNNLPVLANADYGHATPIITIPLGGYAKIDGDKLTLQK